MIKKIQIVIPVLILAFLIPATVYSQVTLVPFVSNVFSVTDIANCGDDRLFIVEQQGRIKIADLDGNLNPVLFLNIVSKVKSGGEQGLLGLAFSPRYNVDGMFYINYTNPLNQTVISRFRVLPGNPDVADSLSEEILITIPQPYTNHNGGAIHFGNDGYLYIGMGDGGSGGDPGDRAQNLQVLLGKMLRINVNTDSSYTIPVSNPYFNSPAADPHIWAAGLRNPWRFSFDRLTGDMWIADVGQNAWEEINFQPAASTGGENYGWRCYEADQSFNLTGCQMASAYDFPVYQYSHASDCSVTGGYVYRGALFNNIYGRYFFADFCSGKLRSLFPNDSNSYSMTLHGLYGSNSYTTFGQDRYGEIYLGKYISGVVKLVDSVCTPVAFISEADSIVSTSDAYLLSTPYNAGLTYQWYFNNQPISSANKSTYLARISGKYKVMVFKNDSCFNESKIITLFLNQKNLFEMYPNPAVDYVELVWSQNFKGRKSVEVIDITGRLVLSENIKTSAISHRLTTRHLAHGVYIIRMIHEGNYYSRKLVVR